MARKKGQDSREKLLETAWSLVQEHGRAGISVDTVVRAAGLSKGTFFHFFPNKHAFLEALCLKISDLSWKDLLAVVDRRDLDPVARLNLFFRMSRSWRTERARAVRGLWTALTENENAAMFSRMRELGIDRLVPVVEEMIREGAKSGSMRVSDPATAARVMVEWITSVAEANQRMLIKDGEKALDVVARRVNFAIESFENILGIASGSLDRVDRKTLARMARGGQGGRGGNREDAGESRR